MIKLFTRFIAYVASYFNYSIDLVLRYTCQTQSIQLALAHVGMI